MAAPTFVGAGAGVVITTGSAAVTAAGSGVQVGDLVILQVLQDGTAASAVTYSAISGIANLAGTAAAMDANFTGERFVGNPQTGKQMLSIGRATSTTCSVTVATTGDDLYCRMYVFRGVATGSLTSDVMENNVALYANANGTGTSVTDVGVVTLGADRLALQFVALNDDVAIDAFVGATGGTWAEAVAEYATATGTDGCIQLQTAQTGTLVQNAPAITGNYNINGDPGAIGQVAQSFLVSAAGTVTQVQVNRHKSGSPVDSFILEIQSDAGGVPSGTVIGTVSTESAAAMGTTATLVSYPCSIAVTAGTYWLVARRSGARDNLNSVRWNRGTGNTYADGVVAFFNSPTWAATGTDDTAFTVFTTGAGTIDGGSDTIVTAGWGVIGFALKPLPSGAAHTATPADPIALADASTLARGKAVADALARDDAFSRIVTAARAFPDSVALVDSITPVHSVPGEAEMATPADVLALADAVHIDWLMFRPLSERVDLADSFSRTTTKARTLADTLALTDSLARATTNARTLADVLALTDSPTRAVTSIRTIADSLVLADLISPVETAGGIAHTLPLADVLALLDSFTRASGNARSIADVLLLADARAFSRGKTVADALVLADAVARAAAKTKALADSLALSDSFARVMAYGRTQADGLILADSTRDAQGIRLGDVVALVDALARLTASVRTFTDAVALSDSTTRAATKPRVVTDAIALTDQLTQAVAKARTLTDSVILADQLARAVQKTRTLADAIALADTRSLAQGQALADAIALSDLLSRVAPRVRTFADSVLLSDATLTSKTGSGQLNPADLVQVADSFSRLATYSRSLADSVALADARSIGRGKRVSDQIVLSDLLSRAQGRQRSLADSIALSDALARTAARVRSVADAVAVTDAVAIGFAGVHTRLLTDLLAISDSLARAAVLNRTLADVVALTDQALPSKVSAKTTSISDLVAVADALTRAFARQRSLADVISLYDAISIVGGHRMTAILNEANDIRWGEIQADVVYLGDEEVWRPT